jgi:hypothetical protein
VLGKLLRSDADAAGPGTVTRYRFLPSRIGTIEQILIFGTLLAIEHFWMSPGDFDKIEPHPYWIPVILLALQYGTSDALLAATIAILGSLWIGWPTQGVGEEYFRYLIRTWIEPVGWILAAILIGEVRSRQRAHVATLSHDLAESRTQAADITQHCHKLDDKIGRLERELAGVEGHSLDAVLVALEDLEAADAATCRRAMDRAQRLLIGGGTSLLLLRQGLAVVPAARIVAEPDAGRPPAEAEIEPVPADLVETSMREPRTLAALRLSDSSVMGDRALLAAALRTSPQSPAFGFLLLESIGGGRFGADIERRFELFRRELSAALARRGFDDLAESPAAGWRIELAQIVTSPDEAGAAPKSRLARYHRA